MNYNKGENRALHVGLSSSRKHYTTTQSRGSSPAAVFRDDNTRKNLYEATLSHYPLKKDYHSHHKDDLWSVQSRQSGKIEKKQVDNSESGGGLRSLVHTLSGIRSTSAPRSISQEKAPSKQRKDNDRYHRQKMGNETTFRVVDVRDVPYTFQSQPTVPIIGQEVIVAQECRGKTTDDILQFLESEGCDRDDPEETGDSVIHLDITKNVDSIQQDLRKTNAEKENETVSILSSNQSDTTALLEKLPSTSKDELLTNIDGQTNSCGFDHSIETLPINTEIELFSVNYFQSQSEQQTEKIFTSVFTQTEIDHTVVENIFDPKEEQHLISNDNIDTSCLSKDETILKGEEPKIAWSSADPKTCAVSVRDDQKLNSNPDMILATLLHEKQKARDHYESIESEVLSMMTQRYEWICNQYNALMRDNDDAQGKISLLENEIKNLKLQASTPMRNGTKLHWMTEEGSVAEPLEYLQQTIEVSKKRIGYLSNENQRLRKENSEWRELCQELMAIVEANGVSMTSQQQRLMLNDTLTSFE